MVTVVTGVTMVTMVTHQNMTREADDQNQSQDKKSHPKGDPQHCRPATHTHTHTHEHAHTHTHTYSWIRPIKAVMAWYTPSGTILGQLWGSTRRKEGVWAEVYAFSRKTFQSTPRHWFKRVVKAVMSCLNGGRHWGEVCTKINGAFRRGHILLALLNTTWASPMDPLCPYRRHGLLLAPQRQSVSGSLQTVSLTDNPFHVCSSGLASCSSAPLYLHSFNLSVLFVTLLIFLPGPIDVRFNR